MEIGTRENTTDATTAYTTSATPDTPPANSSGWLWAQSDSDRAPPSRQRLSVRREMIASTTPIPATMAVPLTHSETNAEYHGAAGPPGSQFASGRKPKIVASMANAMANQRERDRGGKARSGLATGEPDQ